MKERQRNRALVFKFHTHLCAPIFPKLSIIYKIVSQNDFTPKIVPTKQGAYIGKSENLIFSLQELLTREMINPAYENLLARRLAELHSLLYSQISDPIKNHFTRTVVDIKTSAFYYGFEHLIPLIKEAEDMAARLPKQILHGDLHSENIIFHKGRVFFIDFDSATFFNTVFDVVFAAFRCLRGDPEKMYQFVKSYNDSSPPCQIEKSFVWHFLAYAILQRILFIFIERDNGTTAWMRDLDNQKRYFYTVLKRLDSYSLTAKSYLRQTK